MGRSISPFKLNNETKYWTKKNDEKAGRKFDNWKKRSKQYAADYIALQSRLMIAEYCIQVLKKRNEPGNLLRAKELFKLARNEYDDIKYFLLVIEVIEMSNINYINDTYPKGSTNNKKCHEIRQQFDNEKRDACDKIIEHWKRIRSSKYLLPPPKFAYGLQIKALELAEKFKTNGHPLRTKGANIFCRLSYVIHTKYECLACINIQQL